MLEKKEQKLLWTLWECSADISPKITVFRVSENPLWKHRDPVNRWKRRLKINLPKTCNLLGDLALIFLTGKKSLQLVRYFSIKLQYRYFITRSLGSCKRLAKSSLQFQLKLTQLPQCKLSVIDKDSRMIH